MRQALLRNKCPCNVLRIRWRAFHAEDLRGLQRGEPGGELAGVRVGVVAHVAVSVVPRPTRQLASPADAVERGGVGKFVKEISKNVQIARPLHAVGMSLKF